MSVVGVSVVGVSVVGVSVVGVSVVGGCVCVCVSVWRVSAHNDTI